MNHSGMKFKSSLKMSFNGIKANKLRSALTMLGIIIGVAAVIVMISIGQGATKSITDQISSMGANLLTVNPSMGSMGPVRGAGGSMNTLTMDDCEAIEELSLVTNVSPTISGSATLAQGSETWTTQYTGTTPSYQTVKEWSLASGMFISEEDVKNATNVAVIGQTIVDELYTDGTNPIGSSLRINKLSFTVIGVLESKGSSGMGQDEDDVIFIPITTAQRKFLGTQYVSLINIQVASQEAMDAAENSVTTLLRERHRLADSEEDDFQVMNQASLIETIESTSAVMTMLLASVAGVSLVVGGIGIMNIMLVSVTERTREVGLRMAIGATERNIRNQFMVEALMLCLFGGFVGIVLGIIGSKLLSLLGDWSTSVTAYSILLSVGFSVGIGVFFGYYPAKKAAQLDPIEALRFEN